MGGSCAVKGRCWKVVCYDRSLMNRWPNGCRKNISFLGAARAAIFTLLTNFFKSFLIFLSLAFKGFPSQAPMYIPALFLTHPSHADISVELGCSEIGDIVENRCQPVVS